MQKSGSKHSTEKVQKVHKPLVGKNGIRKKIRNMSGAS